MLNPILALTVLETLVVTDFNIDFRFLFENKRKNENISVEHLKDPEIANEYRKQVKSKLCATQKESNQNSWNNICEIYVEISEHLIPKTSKRKKKKT